MRGASLNEISIKFFIGVLKLKIRKMERKDISGVVELLKQVETIHHMGRPDLFKSNSVKYNENEIDSILDEKDKYVFVAVDDKDKVIGYAFCVLKQFLNDNVLTDIKTLYIDDLCVDEDVRGKRIGQKIYEEVKEFAKLNGCYNITLNVWCCNPLAMEFYEKLGLRPQKIGMEMIL